MRRLRELLENHPGVSGQLYESKIVSRYDYPAVEEIQEAYNELIKIRYIGDQYRWIPEYCRHEGLDSIEVSVESDNEFLRKHYNDEEYPFGVLFQSLEFPLIKYSKIDMKEWCEKQGFMDVMELTWFCHTPTKAGSPCGTCRPCIIVMERGLDYRMPLSARYRYHLRILPRIKGFLKRYSRIYAVLVKTKSELKK
nr:MULTISPECIES: 7-cyano-7-deazaguanine synthase [Halomonas]